ncbi:transporter [Robertkochia solimangrovi]|uniref:transporter n=1 Tax=Robertkochia solimangrovi TaxID=2213046 RepID=UPI0011809B57|nr:transporter [Robertkochia solimangrovi]TRZ45355.1 transporter [Robertkochia solimangrovi]
MKPSLFLGLAIFLIASTGYAQYTDVINSNRPGSSYSAYAVGTNVLQVEGGLFYDHRDHSGLNTTANQFGLNYVVRYGLFFEQLEIILDGSYAYEKVKDHSTLPEYSYNQSDFQSNTIGAKYLIYDPFKKNNTPNLYSWKANNTFQWKNLIPAIAVYAGANFNFGDNPFHPEDPTVSPKVMLATQHHLTPKWVLVTNLIYDKFTGDDPLFNYIITLTHALNDRRYTVFAEHQGYKSDLYGDGVFRVGAARLIGTDLQVDAALGTNIKDTPKRYFGSIGLSWRWDKHKDKAVDVDNISNQEKRAIKKRNRKNKKGIFEIDEN